MPKNLFLLYHVLSSFTEPLLVGGCVRDMLIGGKPKDFDIVIPPQDIELVTEKLESAGFRIKQAGLRFLVIHASKEGENFEVAFFRNDGEYVDGKPVSVEPGCIQTDAMRRDFTVNALYFDWKESKQENGLPILSEGDILDPTCFGLMDVQNRTLRFVGKAKDRIKEDPMRVFRFYRFLSKGFEPNPSALRNVRQMFPECLKMLSDRSAEGVREELEKFERIMN